MFGTVDKTTIARLEFTIVGCHFVLRLAANWAARGVLLSPMQMSEDEGADPRAAPGVAPWGHWGTTHLGFETQ